MLTVAAANLAGPRLVADAQRLPFATGAFDLTVALTLLEFVDDPARIVAELARSPGPAGGCWWPRSIGPALRPGPPPTPAPPTMDRRAGFLTRSTLRTLGHAHGTTRLQAVLDAPSAVPGLDIVGPLLERLGRPLPWLGAWQLLVVDRR
jgi:SAM-dependent methyltransferase